MSGELINYYSFAGGRNDFDPAEEIPDNQYTGGSNTRLVGQKLVTRPGYAALNTTTGAYAITGLFDNYVAGTSYLMAMDTRGYIYKMDYSAGSPDGTFDSIGTGFDTGATIRWSLTNCVDGSGNLITVLTNNDDEPQQWTGTGSVANLSASSIRPTKSKIVNTYGFRAVHDSITDTDGANAFRTRWSNFDDATTYSTSDFKDWDNDGSKGVVCSFIHRNVRYVLTSKSIYSMTYTGNTNNNSALLPFTFDESICKNKLGIVGPNAWAEVEGIIVLLAPDKRIYAFDGGCYTEIGREIRTLLDSLEESRLEYVWVRYNSKDKELYIGCDTGSTSANDTIICGNCEGFGPSNPLIRWNNPWTIPANCIEIVSLNGNLTPYFGTSASTGLCYRMLNTTADAGSAISANVQSKVFSPGGSHLSKDLRALDLSVKGQTGTNNLTYDLYKDGSSTSTTGTISQTSTSDPYSPYPMTSIKDVSNYGKVSVKFTQNTLDSAFEIYKFGLINQSNDVRY